MGIEWSRAPKAPTSIRLSEEAERLRDELAEQLGVNKTAVVELAIRELAKKNKIERKRSR